MSPRFSHGSILLAVLLASGCSDPGLPARDAVQQAFRPEGLSGNEARGRRLFVHWCATCHGTTGRGDGQNAYTLDPPPPDFGQSLARLSEVERRDVVVGGTARLGRSPLCPPRGSALRPEDVEALVAYLGAMERLEEPDPGLPGRRRPRPPR